VASTASASIFHLDEASTRRLPENFDTSFFEDAAIMTDAVLWLAKQDLACTGQILTLGELRARGVASSHTRGPELKPSRGC